MKRNVFLFSFIIVTVCVLTLSFNGQVIAAESQKKITIFHTNDSHARVMEGKYEGMGFAKVSSIINSYKDRNNNILVLDAGDTFHGKIIATMSKGESVAKIMNEVGYTAMTPGNHDFNYGYEQLVYLNSITDFPILSANIKKADGSYLLPPYIIKEIDGMKVGILGLSTLDKTHPKNVEGLTFEDPAIAARKVADELKGKVDVLIAITHLGLDTNSKTTSKQVAEAVPQIDLIVDGHSHTVLEQGLEVNDTLIVSTGDYLKNLGVVELSFDGNQLIDKKARSLPKEKTKQVPKNQKILKSIEELEQTQQSGLQQVVGRTICDLDGERENIRQGETNLGNLVTDAMKKATGADLVIFNSGSIRASIEAGDITKEQIITSLPFDNYTVVKKIKGAKVLAALEHGVKDYPQLSGGFPQIAGMNIVFNPTQSVGERIKSVTLGGAPLDVNKDYLLATNDYLAAGGDGYTMLADGDIINEYPMLVETVIHYIKEKGAINPQVEGRTVKDLGTDDNMYVVKPGDNLYNIAQQYGTTWQQLWQTNNLKNPRLIMPGQKIIIYPLKIRVN